MEIQGENIINLARRGLGSGDKSLQNPTPSNADKPQNRTGEKTKFKSTESRIPVNFHIMTIENKTINATKETIKLDLFEPGWFYIITSITGRQETAGTPSIEIAIGQRYSNEEIVLERSSVQNANDTVNAVGEFNFVDSNQIVINFYGANTSNKLHLYAHGYRIRK